MSSYLLRYAEAYSVSQPLSQGLSRRPAAKGLAVARVTRRDPNWTGYRVVPTAGSVLVLVDPAKLLGCRASGMVTTGLACGSQQRRGRCLYAQAWTSELVASVTLRPFSVSREISACAPGGPSRGGDERRAEFVRSKLPTRSADRSSLKPAAFGLGRSPPAAHRGLSWPARGFTGGRRLRLTPGRRSRWW